MQSDYFFVTLCENYYMLMGAGKMPKTFVGKFLNAFDWMGHKFQFLCDKDILCIPMEHFSEDVHAVFPIIGTKEWFEANHVEEIPVDPINGEEAQITSVAGTVPALYQRSIADKAKYKISDGKLHRREGFEWTVQN